MPKAISCADVNSVTFGPNAATWVEVSAWKSAVPKLANAVAVKTLTLVPIATACEDVNNPALVPNAASKVVLMPAMTLVFKPLSSAGVSKTKFEPKALSMLVLTPWNAVEDMAVNAKVPNKFSCVPNAANCADVKPAALAPKL